MTNSGFHTGARAHYLSVIEHRLAARSSEDRKTAFGQSVFNNSSRTSVDQHQNWIFAVNEDEGRYLEEKLITFERWRRCPTFRFMGYFDESADLNRWLNATSLLLSFAELRLKILEDIVGQRSGLQRSTFCVS
jgi:hypothetical protein